MHGEMQRSLPRIYAHFHRLLIELLEDLVQNERVVWLGDEGHLRRPDGEPNTYRKALYATEDFSPYQKRLNEIEQVQREGQTHVGAKRPGLLLPVVVEGVQHAVLRRSTNYASHRLSKEAVVVKLTTHLAKTKGNLDLFKRYARPFDPRREKIESEVSALEVSLERLRKYDETIFRERARTERTSAKLLLTTDPHTGEERVETVYIREAGLIVVGSGIKGDESRIVFAQRRKRRRDRMKLEPLLTFGNFEIFSERAWQAVKEEADVHP